MSPRSFFCTTHNFETTPPLMRPSSFYGLATALFLYINVWSILVVSVSAAAESVLGDLQDGFSKMFDEPFLDFDGVMDTVEDVLERSTLAGQIGPLLKRFLVKQEQLQQIYNTMAEVIQISDLTFLMVIGWCLVPTIAVPYRQIQGKPFEGTSAYHVTKSISQIAKLGLLVYLFDMIKIFLLGAGFQIQRGDRLTHAFTYILYTVWAALQLSKFKDHIVRHWTLSRSQPALDRSGNGASITIDDNVDLGRVQILNRLGDAFLVMVAGFLILDILNLEMGMAMTGVVAFGSMGTLAVSLASQGIVSNLLHGIILSASDRIYEGDKIQLQKSGYHGSVVRLGWLETIIRGNDEILLTVPNTDLLSQQVCNLSRIPHCNVNTKLKFPNSDSVKLPQLIASIKREIRLACPTVITDGTRPFRVSWTDFSGNALEVTVDAHFRIKPVGDKYFENRQNVLQAIDQAVKDNGMSYA